MKGRESISVITLESGAIPLIEKTGERKRGGGFACR